MPIYVWSCPYCGHRDEFVYAGIKEYNKPRDCKKCQEPMVREITTHKSVPFTPYYHKALDRWFGSRSEEKAYAKKNGFVDISGDFGKRLSWSDSHPTKHVPMIEKIKEAKFHVKQKGRS